MAKKGLSDLTTHCIRCGFCLESCPTFKVTGEETESPRGRIYLIRSAMENQVDWQDVRPHLDRCLGCLNCETACPSGVEYGQILELAREKLPLAASKHMLLDALTSPKIARAQFALALLLPGRKLPKMVAKLLSGESAEAEIPKPEPAQVWPELDESALPAIKGEVTLLAGCVMQVLFPNVHIATQRLLRRAGYRTHVYEQGCCGAMHAHSGLLNDARRLAADLGSQLKGAGPIIVNSAGCGSTIKHWGHLDPDLEATASRCRDVSEFLVQVGFEEVIRSASVQLGAKVTYHDACHLAHGQRIVDEPRKLIRAFKGIDYRELEEAATCCGSAGTYNVFQPSMARELLERKWKNIEATGAEVVVTGNPGCHAWIAQAAREHGRKVAVVHTAEFLERALSGLPLS